jgi:hypothetical protein
MSLLKPMQVVVNWLNNKCSSPPDHVIIDIKPIIQQVFIPKRTLLSCSDPKPTPPTFLLPPLWDDREKEKDKRR